MTDIVRKTYDESEFEYFASLRLVNFAKESGEFLRKNWIGNQYKQVWRGYFLDEKKPHTYCYEIDSLQGTQEKSNLVVQFKNKWELNKFLKRTGVQDGKM